MDGLRINGLGGLTAPFREMHKPQDVAPLASVLCFDRIPGAGTDLDSVSVTGLSAGSACSLVTTPTNAHLIGVSPQIGQESHLRITPHPTGAVLQGHDFYTPKGVTIHLYQYFDGEWPVEDDFNFFELHQGGNLIFALRVINLGAGDTGMSVIDADGTSVQVGLNNALSPNSRHLIQITFLNTTKSLLMVEMDHFHTLRRGAVPDEDSTDTLNFRDPAGGPISVFLKNASTGPISATNVYCCGAYIRAGWKASDAFFVPEDLISTGEVSIVDAAAADFKLDGSPLGDVLESGTSLSFSDGDTATFGRYLSGKGGLWKLDRPPSLTDFAVRLGQTYNWVYTINGNGADGPPDLRLHFGGTKESPSNADIAFGQEGPGVALVVHKQVIVEGDLSPLPSQDQNLVSGFEVLGRAGAAQSVDLIAMMAAAVYLFPYDSDPHLSVLAGAGGGLLKNMRVLCKAGETRLSSVGAILIHTDMGFCQESCGPEVLKSGVMTCACGDGSSDVGFDLTGFLGSDVGPLCAAWRLIVEGNIVIDNGIVDGTGKLVGLPATVLCMVCHDSFIRLEIGCIREDRTDWPS